VGTMTMPRIWEMAGRARRLLASLKNDRRGAAALEFALIAPILLSLYLVTVEVAQGIESNKKISRVGSMVADLVTQQQTMSTLELDGIMAIGEAILQPYNRTRPKITVTAIRISDDNVPEVRVAWSRKLENGIAARAVTPNSITTVPERLRIRNTFLIRVTSELDYRPIITWTAEQKASIGLAAAFDRIEMAETYYLRPRMSTEIPCGNC
jgi:Flp pilus assembly protein TadG